MVTDNASVAPTDTIIGAVGAPQRFLVRRQLCEKVNLTFPHIWQLIRRGEFPMGREIGRKIVWLESDVDAWMLSLPRRQYKAVDEERS